MGMDFQLMNNAFALRNATDKWPHHRIIDAITMHLYQTIISEFIGHIVDIMNIGAFGNSWVIYEGIIHNSNT